MLFDALYGGLQSVLDLRQQQHALTAGNLANANTPGFKAKFLELETALPAAVQRTSGLAQAAPLEGHMVGGGQLPAHVVEADPVPWAVDDNSVLMERETARLHENALLYRAVSAGLSRRLAVLKYAANDGG